VSGGERAVEDGGREPVDLDQNEAAEPVGGSRVEPDPAGDAIDQRLQAEDDVVDATAAAADQADRRLAGPVTS
jgi:hypothetical protein